MNLVVFFDEPKEKAGGILQFALANPLLAGILARRYGDVLSDRPAAGGGLRLGSRHAGTDLFWAVPEGWDVSNSGRKVVRFSGDLALDMQRAHPLTRDDWWVISNGRSIASWNWPLLRGVLGETSASVAAVCANPALAGYHERTLVAGDGRIVGFRRFYDDGIEPVPMSKTWPHCLVIRARDRERVLPDGVVPRDFSRLVDTWHRHGVASAAFEVAGSPCDLSTEAGLLDFLAREASGYDGVPQGWTLVDGQGGTYSRLDRVRTVGKVWLGSDVRIGSDVVLVGPSVIGDRVKVEDKAVVVSSIVASGVTIGSGCTLRDSLLTEAGPVQTPTPIRERGGPTSGSVPQGFRTWPWFAYAGGPKRVVDIVVAGVVLILFAPVFPLISLAIKLDSEGPIFFRDLREGRRGRPFRCLKFRSMKTGADQIQEKLRTVSEVDGPQFKMVDDPRITRVGHFLRETYLDEIPQFFNVLVGEMSVIGPRPSPRAENTLCPYWRHARLSVRPGLTGLWQIKRTRQPMKDFQEWITYDTEYVRNMSFGLDAKICWQTFLRMGAKFGEQF